MKLLIVESPSKAKTISKYLGKDFKVMASVGHIRDLPKSNKKAIDIEGGFIPHYEIVKGKDHIIDEIREFAEKADEVILATDPDREGEAIAWHIKEVAKLKNPKRIVFHEITKEAVEEGLAHARSIDQDLRQAQEARRVLDRLVGYDLSGLIWKKVRYGLSAGRVQSPALRIIMEREREIRAFKPEDFWVITANVKNTKEDAFTLTCVEEPKTQKEAERILDVGKKEEWKVKEVKEAEGQRLPYAPFITSTLQQAASSRLGFSPSRTMMIAQKLYEAGLITYMRTDSPTISKAAQESALQYVRKTYGDEYAHSRVYKSKSKSAQEAHEAIRPTNLIKENAGTTPEQKKLYELIWRRTISSQMTPAKILKTKITAQIGKGEVPDFAITGSRVLFPGWLAVDTAARGEDVELPKVAEGEKLTLVDMHSEQKQTQPPPRYTEAGLIKELEKRGIGRPSTYATIMKTLADRGYVEKQGRSLAPTDVGDVVSTFIEDNFSKYVSDTFTAEMENELDEIAEGKRGYEKTLRDFYTPFKKDVGAKEHIEKLTTLGDAPKEFPCPTCGASMVMKLGRGGKFMSCSRYPECEGARTAEGKVLEAKPPLGTDPETGEQIFILEGRFGPYVQKGEAKKGSRKKPKRASIPPEITPEALTLPQALKLLSLPRELGAHPESGQMISAGIGRFGPFIVHEKDFRSLKEDDVYAISYERALEILKEPKKRRGWKKKAA